MLTPSILVLSASLLSSNAGPIVRRYDSPTQRTGIDTLLNHDTYRSVAASGLRHAELRGGDGLTESGREYGLRDSESFYWGPNGFPQANMTAITADSNVKVLSIERFRDAVSEVECTASSIELTLRREIKFDALQASWAWVNGAEENYIVFVTDGCSEYDDDGIGKQAWHVTSVAFNDNDNTASLSATPVLWEEAFQKWHLHVSSKSLLPEHNTELSVRDISQGSIPLEADFSTTPYPLSTTAGAPTLACDPCGITGALDYDFSLDRDGLSLTASVALSPSGLGAAVTAALAIEEPLSAEARLTKNLLQRPINGIKVGSWVSIGPQIYVDLIAAVESATAAASLSAGLTMSIPDDSMAKLSMDSDDNEFSGWAPTFESTLSEPDFSAAVSLSAQAGLQIRAEFDVLVKLPAGKTKGLAAGLVLDAPLITFAAEAKLEEGACDVEDAEGGVDVNLGVGGELAAFAGAGKPADLPNKVDVTAVGPWPIFTTCWPLTDGASPTASSVSSVSSSAVPPWGNFSRKAF